MLKSGNMREMMSQNNFEFQFASQHDESIISGWQNTSMRSGFNLRQSSPNKEHLNLSGMGGRSQYMDFVS